MAPRETENNGYAKCWGYKQRPLWYVMVFSGVVDCKRLLCGSQLLDLIYQRPCYLSIFRLMASFRGIWILRINSTIMKSSNDVKLH